MRHGIQPREAGPPALLLQSALRGGIGMLRLSSAALRGATAAGGEPAGLCELGNKLEVFELFQYTLAAVGASGGASLPLAEAVRRAAARGRFASVWITEGVGHALAEAAWRGPRPPRGLLSSLAAGAIPAEAWIPLHTGMGLSLAGRVLRAPPSKLRDALRQLFELCVDNALPGYARAAFEGLGFAARNLHSRSVPAIGRELAHAAPGLESYFWHGVGRGLYFSPAHAAPGSTGAALAAALCEPPHGEGRRNAVAGLAWAVTLVNLRQPEILAAFLARQARRPAPPAASALADGIAAAAAVWCDAAGPGDGHLSALLGHRPGDPETGELWRRLVVEPCREAIRRQPGLRRSRGLEALFRCRTQRDPS
jgi:hypothetical protein